MECCGKVGSSHCHCALCHQTFATLESFDWHQVRMFGQDPPVTCLAVPEFGQLRLAPDRNGVWRTPEGMAKYERVRGMVAGFARQHGGGEPQTA